jgi:alpha-ketoglutarate-dependent taurine dioxygenase
MIKSVPLTKHIGEMVKGKRLTRYTNKDIADLKKLLFYRKAVFFEDQNLTKEELLEFSHRLKSSPDAQVFEQEIDSREVYHYGEAWHSDRDYMDPLPLYTAFQINRLPKNKVTGATEFADMVSLYNFGISKVFQNMLNDLTAYHEYLKAEVKINDQIIGKQFYRAVHPVVLKTDFEDKTVNSLFLNPAHVTRILGLHDNESEAILKVIYEKLYQYTEFHYIHRWKKGSLVIWNNRLCNHRGLKDFEKDDVRIAIRTVIY